MDTIVGIINRSTDGMATTDSSDLHTQFLYRIAEAFMTITGDYSTTNQALS